MPVDRISVPVSASVDQQVGLAFKTLQSQLDKLVTQINAALSGEAVSAGSTYTAGSSVAGKVILLDTVTGSVVTLPAATGTKHFYHFMVSVLATSNSHKIQVANATDIMQGVITTVSDNSNAVLGWRTADDSDTITLNRSTTGSVERGEWITLFDSASGVWLVNGTTASTGTEATPFSAAVA